MGNRFYALLLLLAAAVGLAAADVAVITTPTERAHQRVHDLKVADLARNAPGAIPEQATGAIPCTDGMAGAFPCDGVDLLSFTPLADLGFVNTDVLSGGGASDIWGWTSPDTGAEYVLLGHTNGVAAVDVSDPTAPVYLGSVPNLSPVQLIWHDIKVVADHAVIASESAVHGVQVVDLRRLDGMDGSSPQLPILPDSVYPLSGSQHNIVVNPDAEMAYVVGGGLITQGLPADQCDSGLAMIDMSNPLLPLPAGCYAGSSYVHDAQCLTYEGPDADHAGRDLCIAFAEDHVSIVDVTDPASAGEISRIEYPATAYTHQGWLSEDGRYLLFNDELDEQQSAEVTHTRTMVWDVTDLDAPVEHLIAMRDGTDGNPATASIDHNNYTRDGLAYQSNYTSGLRVIDLDALDDPDGPRWDEVAYFDTYPADDEATFNGTWSNYPYFESGTVAVSGIGEGLFLLRLHDGVGDGPADPLEPADTPPAAAPTHFQRPD
ncbi:choice-of-anchor B family protein [Euzebya sp.]|uniref:choice-of-anchor B family protein n=1 Tax=Euzebya sp. TaxID=1971409 RepID=UPI0035162FE4